MYMYNLFFIFRRRKDHLLSPVPENFSGRAMNSSSSDVGFGIGVRGWNFGPQSVSLSRGSMHHSMESVSEMLYTCTCTSI